jgi:hypothetical protein
MYQITYRDGTTEPAGTYLAACNRIKAGWPEAVIGHHDLSDGGDSTLCWADETDANNDDEANAIARIWWIDD